MLVALASVAACGARTPLPSPGSCRALDEDIEPVTAELDMHLLLDSSESMEDVTPAGTKKWDAVVGALQVFFESPDAAGLGVGLSCFPVLDPDVPDDCSGNDDACGVPGACMKLGVCLESETPCDVAFGCTEEAFPEEVCTPVGTCELAPDQYCAPSIDADCPEGDGACILLGACENRSSCEIGVYSRPLVPMQSLPEVGDALLATMHERKPEGGTTTLPALVGVHAQALAALDAGSARRQVVVLGTDGLPTSCDPSLDGGDDTRGVQHLAEVAEAAVAKGVRTFVVGVFSEEEAEAAQENLDAVARAGGTERAFVVGAEASLTTELARALEEARVSATSCEYELPSEAADVDLERTTITLRSQEGDRRLELLPSASACTDGSAGVYVLSSANAGRLVLCPSLCASSIQEGLPPINLSGGCVAG